MATVQGAVQGITLINAPVDGVGARKTFLVTLAFAAANASDVAEVSALHTSIQNAQKNGKTFTMRRVCPAHPGYDASGAAVYATGVVTVAATNGWVNFALGGVTATATALASNGVGIYVVGDES